MIGRCGEGGEEGRKTRDGEREKKMAGLVCG